MPQNEAPEIVIQTGDGQEVSNIEQEVKVPNKEDEYLIPDSASQNISSHQATLKENRNDLSQIDDNMSGLSSEMPSKTKENQYESSKIFEVISGISSVNAAPNQSKAEKYKVIFSDDNMSPMAPAEQQNPEEENAEAEEEQQQP